jgi:hypothetical protein
MDPSTRWWMWMAPGGHTTAGPRDVEHSGRPGCQWPTSVLWAFEIGTRLDQSALSVSAFATMLASLALIMLILTVPFWLPTKPPA